MPADYYRDATTRHFLRKNTSFNEYT